MTAAIGLDDEHVRTTAGGFYAWSNGEGTPSGATGVSAPLHSQGFGALLTTAYVF